MSSPPQAVGWRSLYTAWSSTRPTAVCPCLPIASPTQATYLQSSIAPGVPLSAVRCCTADCFRRWGTVHVALMGGWRRLLSRVWHVAPLFLLLFLLSALTKAADPTVEGAARLPAALHADGHGEREAGGEDRPRTGDVHSPAQQPPECWVFSHMNKSGGESVKAVLKAWTDRHNAASPTSPSEFTMRWYDDRHWRSGSAFAHEYLSRRPTLSVGAYTQGRLAYEARPCKWFTIFRQ